MSEPVLNTDSEGAFRAIVREGAGLLGLQLSEGQALDFERLAGWLLDWNTRMNLTAVREPNDVAVKHVLDSLTCLVAHPFPHGARVIDVGTGAGFPGLALKIARPDLEISLLDSTRKKLTFVEFVIEQMRWRDVRAVFGRAEEIGHEAEHREAYDVVVARAVAAMRILGEFCLPLARVGGAFLAMKGPSMEEEMRPALPALERLGGRPGPPAGFTLPFGGGERAVVPVEKVAPTPARYPRLYREIKRAPL